MPEPRLSELLKTSGSLDSLTPLERLADRVLWLGMLLATLTVCTIPWLLGGVIPLARLVLQLGATASAACCLPALCLAGRQRRSLPTILVPALGLAVCGLVQLLPLYEMPVEGMKHAVHSEYRQTVIDARRSVSESAGESVPGAARTVSPADTRLAVAQWLSVTLLAVAGHLTLNTASRLRISLTLMAVNAVAITIMGLLQLFGDGSMLVGSHWIQFSSRAFATFTNSNNAAGWLCLHFGVLVGLMVLVWGNAVETGFSRPFGEPTLKDQFWTVISKLQLRLAQLTSLQILVLVMLLTVLCGIFATLSRGAMIAVVLSIAAASWGRKRWKSVLLLMLPMLFTMAAAAVLLTLLDLNGSVVAELETLRNPLSQATGRLLHWSEVLWSVLDFPVLGTGMNAYRFASLPYVSHDFEKWFYHADNQFVEVLVENGLTGFLSFSAILGLALYSGFRLNAAVDRVRRRDQLMLTALGLMMMIATVSQIVVAVFDFGAGLPSATSVLLFLAGAAMSPFGGSADVEDTSGHRVTMGVGVIPAPGWLIAAFLAGLVLATVTFLPELRTAQQIYDQGRVVDRVLRKPVMPASVARLSTLGEHLQELLKQRPDDPGGLESAALIAEAQFRAELIRRMSADLLPADEQYALIWETLTPPGVASRMLQLRETPEHPDYALFLQIVRQSLETFPWPEKTRSILHECPWIPGLTLQLLSSQLFQPPVQLDESLIERLLFHEPANSRRLFQAGYFCLKTGREQLAVRLWEKATSTTDRYRSDILREAASYWSPHHAVSKFAPKQFVNTVRTATSMPPGQLRDLLWEHAEQQWELLQGETSAEQDYLRAVQLQAVEGDAVAVEWLSQCLQDYPDHLEIGIMMAGLQERTGNRREAIKCWSRILYFYPDHQQALQAIERLSQD